MRKRKFKFIDLFAGIGGFHQAMNKFGECVFAAEIDQYAIETYKENYGIDACYDVTKIDPATIPDHDFLCAGFPCQAFSKAGQRLGFKDQNKGTLFFQICKILEHHQTNYFILENVRNLASHDKGRTWATISNSLKKLGYVINEEPIIISPHHLGIPQLRERVVIIGIHKSLGIKKINVQLPNKTSNKISFLDSQILETNVDPKYYISELEEKIITCWDQFIKGIKYVPMIKVNKQTKTKKYFKAKYQGVLGFPVWVSEFRKTDDYSNVKYEWKKNFIAKNRYFYQYNKKFIDKWLKKWNDLNDFPLSKRKLEWQCGTSCQSLWDGLIQFRPSGVRVKAPTLFPALVAMVQIPIIGKVKRKLTPREAARLQSFPDWFKINPNDHQAYKQFGNAVNVEVITYIIEQLLQHIKNKNINNNSSIQTSK
ncbi:DNA (cytosine-5-)-methyltransferase [[Mycoplasma] cavipharyngis]|uniref:DNA cytosine methyltransferase n=1 Tax=[Mycoplasma] cavipharyngis TaxID=92757 RepID=UPI003704A2CF